MQPSRSTSPAPPSPAAPSHIDTATLVARLLELRAGAVAMEEAAAARLEGMDDETRTSAANLLHYLAVRRVDLRPEQRQLSRLGLSSLGRAEAHVLASLDAVIGRLARDLTDGGQPPPQLPVDLGQAGVDTDRGDELLARHAEEVFGPAPARHDTRTMVTLPSEAAADAALVERLARAGMAIARINCAHDDPSAWAAMARNVALAAAATGRSIRIACDLPGPKLRTGAIAPDPAVVKSRPTRDILGRVVAPARTRFVPTVGGQPRPGPSVVVDGDLCSVAAVGDELRLVDSRGRRRRLRVDTVRDGFVEATSDRTTYFTPGLDLTLHRGGETVATSAVGAMPSRPGALLLSTGDLLELRLGDDPGRPAGRTSDGTPRPASVSIDLPDVFVRLQPGHRVLFDDGALAAVVRQVTPDRAILEMTHRGTAKLRAGKGVNLPDTDLDVAALTDDDIEALAHVVPFADLVALSFVADPRDVTRLHDALDGLGAAGIGVVLKIERRAAFEALPLLLLAALRRPPVAVMVARGDLAVEVGFERLAELQEEILWLCEAAHVPVIWATQVLESLAKSGAPTRAEITDAAWASRAECVMLNKGPHIPEALVMLDDILARMQEHQDKRVPMLRPLAVADALTDLVPPDRRHR